MNQSERPTAGEGDRAASPARWPALAVLVPTLPMLLGSIALLLVFYLAPTRFNAFLERLPGDDLIRTILIFAPVTLFAVVVLALLYALEGSAQSAETVPQPGAEKPAAAAMDRRRLAWLAIAIGIPLLVLGVAAALFYVVAPERLAAWLRPLPGDSLWRPLLRFAPVPPLILLLPAGLYLLSRSSWRQRLADPLQPARLGSLLTLLTALPLLLLSTAALGVFLVSPARFSAIVERLSLETLMKTALVFAPVILLSLVLLAVLYLISSRSGLREQLQADRQLAGSPPAEDRARLAVWVLSLGLGGTGVVVLALFGVMVALVLR